MNKRAQESFTMVQWIGRMLFLVVVLFAILFLLRRFVSDNLNVQDVQAEVFTHKILYSPNGFLFFDAELGKAVVGVVDVSKITNERFASFIDYKDTAYLAARVTVFDMSKKQIASAHYNQQAYDRWIQIAKTELTGVGGVRLIQKSTLISYVNGTNAKPGILEITILMPGN